MITLDPEFVGTFAAAKSMVTSDGSTAAPFARLSRLDRLRLQGNLDEAEDAEVESEADEDVQNSTRPKEKEKEKSKMRGKNKSMKK